ncbi:DUF3078 domain-containing protein [Sediminibacterium goheungense]|uniref:DUF3078 family protein n=1 Tax=Sediminibacterium goheungense TaxID=1086393 RepID=A0A4R6ISX2_9BACT|nr:DUF3078 domain-containing protein [Sediminibacterium goheungense]TDO23483.1 Protein of unknown function (DUF3078) [Sediminibacterium goheungense]TDO25086.1 Protein of unknown function (DUF3078) [Sediminibacterium goheungense]
MKKWFFWMLFLVTGSAAFSQDIVVNKLRSETSRTIKKEADTSRWTWKRGGLLSANLSQGSLSNWAAGGDNFSLAVSSYFNFFYFFKKGKHNWDNNFDMNLGYVQTTSLGGRKNDDRFDFLSKYGYKMDSTGKIFLSSLFNFRSQWFDGYTFSGGVPSFASSFLSPAYIILSVGFDYKPNDKLSVFVSPLTSRLTVVANNKLSAQGKYGVPAGKNSVNEIGTFATVNYNNTIAKNVTYKARLDIFSNYNNRAQNIDFFMTNLFSFKINKFFSATYSLDLIYDDDVRLFGPNKTSPGLQTKSLIGIGFLKPLNVRKG